jgi:hypothetical protein
MRQFSSSGFRLWKLGREARVLYTAFCVLTFLGIVSSVAYYEDLVGNGTRGIQRYYAGVEGGGAVGGAAGPATGGGPGRQGPAIEMPEDAEPGRPIVVAVTYRKLLEVTHFHLFTLPVVLLIVAHLFLATGLGDGAKLGWIGAAIASVALHLASPWLVRYGSARLAFLHVLSGSALTLTMSVLTLYPAFVMWRRPPKAATTTSRSDTEEPAP